MYAISIYKKEISPLMKVKKANLSRVMKKAWQFHKSENMIFSKALIKAWKWYHSPKEQGKRNCKNLVLF